MARINLLPWRDARHLQRKQRFIAICMMSALISIGLLMMSWLYFDYVLNDQEQANQLINSRNQELDQQLKSLDGLEERRNALVERMTLIQDLQAQRPVAVRLIDELVRVTPSQMYITKFSRTGNSFVIEGKAESPATVAEFLRRLEASAWYRNAFMNSFLTRDDKDNAPSSLVPRPEERYGTFIVSADLGEIAAPVLKQVSLQTGSGEKR